MKRIAGFFLIIYAVIIFTAAVVISYLRPDLSGTTALTVGGNLLLAGCCLIGAGIMDGFGSRFGGKS